MAAPLAIRVGDRCTARYLAQKFPASKLYKTRWYPGWVTAVGRGNESYDIAFDDGDEEPHVPAKFVRAATSPRQPAGGAEAVCVGRKTCRKSSRDVSEPDTKTRRTEQPDIVHAGAMYMLTLASAAWAATWVRTFLVALGLPLTNIENTFRNLHSPADTLVTWKYSVIAARLRQPALQACIPWLLINLMTLWYFGTGGFPVFLDDRPLAFELDPRELNHQTKERIKTELDRMANRAYQEFGCRCTKRGPQGSLQLQQLVDILTGIAELGAQRRLESIASVVELDKLLRNFAGIGPLTASRIILYAEANIPLTDAVAELDAATFTPTKGMALCFDKYIVPELKRLNLDAAQVERVAKTGCWLEACVKIIKEDADNDPLRRAVRRVCIEQTHLNAAQLEELEKLSLAAYDARVPTITNLEELCCDFINRPGKGYNGKKHNVKGPSLDDDWDRTFLYVGGRGVSPPILARA